MLIAIFASRKTQRQYASELSKYISSIGGEKPIILWYKDLLKIRHWMKSVFNSKPSELNQVVFEVIAEKKNHPKYRNSHPIYWALFKCIKSIESKLLYVSYRDQLACNHIEQLVIWNGLKFRQRIATIAAKDLEIPCYYIERGAFPETTTLDSKGINYLNSVPRDPSYYMNRDIKNSSVILSCNKKKADFLPENYIFVPFQVNIDSQITMFSPWLDNMFSLVESLLEIERILGDSMPNIVLKSHPSCAQSYQNLFDKIRMMSNKICVVNNVETCVLIRDSKAVVTINSSVGMEALLMRKKVIVLGKAFYNIKGITLSASSLKELVENIIRVNVWKPNEHLTLSFLDYLKEEYIVKGSWQHPDLEHFQSMTQRLNLLTSV